MIASLCAFRWASWRLLCSLATSSVEMFCAAMAGPEAGPGAPWGLWGVPFLGPLGFPKGPPNGWSHQGRAVI
jgi:hypothetical protein